MLIHGSAQDTEACRAMRLLVTGMMHVWFSLTELPVFCGQIELHLLPVRVHDLVCLVLASTPFIESTGRLNP